MPSGSKSRGFRYSTRPVPTAFCTIAASVLLEGVLYRKNVPGLWATGWERNARTQWSSPRKRGSSWWPVDMLRRSRTRIALSESLGFAGASSGNSESTESSRLSLPSAIARPTAVEVKLLVSE